MKKVIALVISVLLCMGIMACGKKPNENAPVITGVKATASIGLGDAFNALDGVTATDKEDGDLTNKIVVTSNPELTFTDGAATPAALGDYEIAYTVKDSGGKETSEYTTLTVGKKVTQEALYKEYEFADAETDMKGWELATAAPAEATLTAQEGRLVLDVTKSGDPGEAHQIQIKKSGFEAAAEATYKINAYLSASVPVKFHFGCYDEKNANAGIGEKGWNLDLTTTVAKYTTTFDTRKGAGEKDVMIAMEAGNVAFIDKNDKGEDIITYQNPEAYKIYVEKIEILTITGEEVEREIYSNDYADGLGGMEIALGDKAAATLTHDTDKASVAVTAYTGNSWEIKLNQTTTVAVEKGKKYRVTADVTTLAAQPYEFAVEDKVKEWQARAFHRQSEYAAGSSTLDFTFTAADNVTDACIRFYLGKGAADVKTNTFTVDNIKLSAVEGDLEENKELIRFFPNTNETEWNCFNGTDEDLGKGVGTMYNKDGKLIYRIAEIGEADYFNKVFINKISLEPFAKYRFELTVKANRPVQSTMVLNVYKTWDPRYTEKLDLTTEEQKISFTTADLVVDMNFELVFSFGKPLNTEPGIVVEFSDVKVFKLS